MKALPSLFAVSFLVFAAAAHAWAQDDDGAVIISDGAFSGSSISDGMVNLSAGPTDPFPGGELSIANEVFDGGSVVVSGGTETINDTGTITLRNLNTTNLGPLSGPLILGSGGTGTLTLSEGYALDPYLNSGTLTVNGLNTYTGATLIVNGTNIFTETNFGVIDNPGQITLTSGNGAQTTSNALVVTGGTDSGGMTTDSIPEPSTAILLLGGLALVGRRRQRRAV